VVPEAESDVEVRCEQRVAAIHQDLKSLVKRIRDLANVSE
jgi:hypothetical protein